MLATKTPLATAAVRNLAAARHFYEERLGLASAGPSQAGTAIYRCGGGVELLVYQSELAGTNRATAVSWRVGDDIDAIARDLAGKGVPFERYTMPGARLEGEVHVFGSHRVAWFKDPDGNIHSLVNG
ncbi:MAG TPA: VOC family protein [Hyphomicrobiales bacterium]|nr:VOC family protein [Hyphomicrobiales bacterium]